jgi:RNA polymerase sigma-70 factor (ECF subfamily)
VPEETSSDAELIAATAAGDREAFGALVIRHQGAILRVARALVPQQAEDVLQETFLAAFRFAGTYRGDAPVRSWLFTIARHAAHRLARKRSEVAADERSIEMLGHAAGWGTDDVERAAVRAEQHAQLTAALERLPEGEREVLALRDAAGLSSEDTAGALGVSVAAMKSRLHRARLHLAAELRARGEVDDAR